MLFHFLSDWINIFRYITFRSMGAAITAFLLVVWLGPLIIQKLKVMKFGQRIREEGPTAHYIKTGTPTMGGLFMWFFALCATLLWGAWNPFILIICLSVILFASIGFIDDYAKIKQKNTKGLSPKKKLFLQSFSALILLILIYRIPEYHSYTESMMIKIQDDQNEILMSTNINILEDWQWEIELPISKNPKNYEIIGEIFNPETGKKEIKDMFKFPSLMIGIVDNYIISSKNIQKKDYHIKSQITKIEKDKDGQTKRKEKTQLEVLYKARLFTAQFLPYHSDVVWYWPLALVFLFFIFIIVGVSNATNLTDGLDGLAIGMGIALYVPFGVFAYLIGNIILSSYLFLPYIAGVGEISIFIAAAIGSFSGFLWYNVHPAEVFMGDTGSLAMGAAISTIAIILKQELLLIIAGFVFVLETLSVIIQVAVYKKTKKRVFKMAPIHHHFELCGWKENQVVVRFWIMGAFCAILALASIKIR